MSAGDSATPRPPAPAATALRVLEPRRGWRALNAGELWAYRELLFFLTWRDVKIRYRQAALGVLWAFLQPFLSLVVFSLVFGRLARVDSEGYPYPIFAFAGLLPWQFFSDAVNRGSQSVVGGAHLVSKVYFPRLILPLASVGAALVDFAIAFLILVGLMLYYGVPPGLPLLAVPLLVLLTVLTALGVGILLSALNVAYRDFRYVVSYMLQLWMFATPVIYSPRAIPPAWRWVVWLNPMAPVVDGYRAAVLGRPFDLPGLAMSVCVSLALLGFGIAYFRRVEDRFADIV